MAPQPIYQTVLQHLLKQISQGRFKPGSRLPSENDLVRQFGISRMTANRVLSLLAADGVVTRIAGVGTFVAEPRVHSHPLQVTSIADEIRARGHAHECRVLKLESTRANAEWAERCDVPAGTRLDHSLLLHLENGTPLQLEDRYVNPKLVRDYLRHDFTRTVPHAILMGAAPIQHAEHTVRAVCPDTALRRLLALGKSEACLLVRRRTWSDRQVVSAADLYHAGSRYELTGQFR
ncbi:MAG: histidine utilization repressor [Steroidobacteraceae bacterium]